MGRASDQRENYKRVTSESMMVMNHDYRILRTLDNLQGSQKRIWAKINLPTIYIASFRISDSLEVMILHVYTCVLGH